MRSLNEPLVSNGYTLAMTSERLGWLEPRTANLPMEQLRETYHQQGYLWLKGFFKRDMVLKFRDFFFETIAERGLQAYFEIITSREYEEFCTMPHLWNFYKEFLQGPPYLHRRKMLRFNIPGEDHCTGGHYDLIYLRSGTDRLCTSWIPLDDIPVEMGGLIYLEHSDAAGRQLEAEFRAKNAELPSEERISAYNRNMRANGWVSTNLAEMAERFNTRWLVADYEAGDMVIHSPYMIHAATLNNDPLLRTRLSTDIRFQCVDDEIDQRWAKDWSLGDDL
ncbi:phytanoyl-CoA dioxygenase family protein [Tengunoibacter tsumagoiensis]|uniref:Phytanoyl-CoA dioxygenase n=1 Tax=Tengunoibacter tsumagoiensis TaxID=2014871 RepID=A0A401ZYN3_9CHLR|nr:phytanoyl-CoA dioxygenase family protein [Tengunoibacter tsumagoiensis]GCE11932.1 phytanoyl-CoA dioxygenase [Tengunoibacter tsumagoiensis]